MAGNIGGNYIWRECKKAVLLKIGRFNIGDIKGNIRINTKALKSDGSL